VWVKITAAWLCFVLYAAAMLMPPCCPDREFPLAQSFELAKVV
jgi:hypothetical protein